MLFEFQADCVSLKVVKNPLVEAFVASTEIDLFGALVVNVNGAGVERNTSETKDDLLRMLDEKTFATVDVVLFSADTAELSGTPVVLLACAVTRI